MPKRPVGVFDSGVGGLSVLREIRTALPGEDLYYVADSGHAPYGDKSADYVIGRSVAIAQFLFETQNAKALVVACNTATAAAIQALRQRYDLPLIGVEPAVKPAVQVSRSGVVGVLATQGTLTSDRFTDLVDRHGGAAKVIVQPCPGLVELVEQGDLTGPTPRQLLTVFIQPLLQQGADTLVLGCTHYPFLAPLVQDIAGPEVTLLETGSAVARQLSRKLAEIHLLNARPEGGQDRFWTSGDPAHLANVLPLLWHHAPEVGRLAVG